MCLSCGAGFFALKSVTDADYAADFLWSETPYPFAPAGWLMWREALRVIWWRIRHPLTRTAT